MKYFYAFITLFLLSACAIKPNYYDVDPFIQIPPVDKVLVDGKEVKSYVKGDRRVEVGTSFSDREITLIKDNQAVSKFTLKTEYVNKRGAVMNFDGGEFIVKNQSNGASPVFLLLPLNTLFGAIPTAGTLVFGVVAQPFLLINDIGLFNEPDYSLHGKAFEPFIEVVKGYNGLIVQDVVNIANFPGVVIHNKWRQNGKIENVKGNLQIPPRN